MNDRTLKRVLQYMRSAKLAEFYQCPLEELDPSAGPCINKKGNVTLKYILSYIINTTIHLFVDIITSISYCCGEQCGI